MKILTAEEMKNIFLHTEKLSILMEKMKEAAVAGKRVYYVYDSNELTPDIQSLLKEYGYEIDHTDCYISIRW